MTDRPVWGRSRADGVADAGGRWREAVTVAGGSDGGRRPVNEVSNLRALCPFSARSWPEFMVLSGFRAESSESLTRSV
jgi:hypothetical protein